MSLQAANSTMNQKNVLFLIDHLGPGGVQEFIYNYCSRQTGERVSVVSIFGKDVYSAKFKGLGVDVIFLSQIQYSYRSVVTGLIGEPLSRLKTFLSDNSNRFDVIHVRLFASFLYCSLLRLYTNEKVVPGLDAANGQLPWVVQIIYKIWARKYRRFMLPKMYLNEFRHFRIQKSNCVGGMYFTTIRTANKPNPFQHKWNLLAAGRMIRQKGFLDTIRLFALVKKHCSTDCGLYLLGDGPQEAALQAFVKRERIDDVHFLGYKKDFENFLCWSSMVVKMAFLEGPNSVVREALTAGIPVASSLELDECKRLAGFHALIPLDRNDLAGSAQKISKIIKGEDIIDTQYLKKFAEEQWSDKTVLDVYTGL
jgi:glycosyltransferase involved in cell wall biosynthesis